MKLSRPFTSVTRWLLVVIGCVVLATAQPMSAAEPAATDAKSTPPRSGDTIIYPKGAADKGGESGPTKKEDAGRGYILVIAVLMAGAGAWVLLQKRKGGLAAVTRGPRKLQIEETRNLGNRQYLVVAEYEGQKFLLGVAPGQIQMLSELKNRGAGETAQ